MNISRRAVDKGTIANIGSERQCTQSLVKNTLRLMVDSLGRIVEQVVGVGRIEGLIGVAGASEARLVRSRRRPRNDSLELCEMRLSLEEGHGMAEATAGLQVSRAVGVERLEGYGRLMQVLVDLSSYLLETVELEVVVATLLLDDVEQAEDELLRIHRGDPDSWNKSVVREPGKGVSTYFAETWWMVDVDR